MYLDLPNSQIGQEVFLVPFLSNSVELFDDIIKNWFDANPLTAHRLGFHDYDGLLPDMSKAKIAENIKQYQDDLARLDQIPEPQDKIERYNYYLIKNRLQTDIFNLEERREFEITPAGYIFPLAVIEISYTSRNFAPIKTRIKHIISIQQQVPKYLDQGLDNLRPQLAKPKVTMAIRFAIGIKNYWQDKLIDFIVQGEDDELLETWSQANLLAIEALDKFVNTLEKEFSPNTHEDFSLGKEKFLQLLKHQEGVDLSVERLLEIGERDLERNFNTLTRLGKRVGGLEEFLERMLLNQPTPDSLLDDVRNQLETIKQYLVTSNFVDLPTDEQCEVIFTPEFARAFASGAMNTPGPFETGEAKQAYYWVSPPDESLTGDKLTEYMKFFSYPMLEILTIHEVWPGHYLQLLFNNKSENKIAKIFARSTAMIEGWAHYGEEAILDSGYDAEGKMDYDIIHAAQLIKALMRNVRYLSAIKMHCYGMSVEESKQLFMEKAFMTPIKSQLESNRGTMDPMYLNYTLGKLMIKKLRQDYQKELTEDGHQFSLKEFHSELLSYGSPPITDLRKLMLKNPGGSADVL